MQLVLDTHGLAVKVRNRSFHIIGKEGKRLIGPERLTSIAVTADCMFSTAALRLAAERQIPVFLLDETGGRRRGALRQKPHPCLRRRAGRRNTPMARPAAGRQSPLKADPKPTYNTATTMPWLIAYDIQDDRLRTKVAARLLEAGFLRLQMSVFAGDPRETTFAAVEKWLRQKVPTGPKSRNRVLLLPCTQHQLDTARVIGHPPDEWEELLDPPNTLII